jgi:hypothetical protein
MRRENDRIYIELSAQQFEVLLLGLGMAAGCAAKDNPGLFRSLLRLANAVNEGNPEWMAYRAEDGGDL